MGSATTCSLLCGEVIGSTVVNPDTTSVTLPRVCQSRAIRNVNFSKPHGRSMKIPRVNRHKGIGGGRVPAPFRSGVYWSLLHFGRS